MIKKDLIIKSIASFVVTSFFITFVFIGCSKQVAGTYVNEKNDKNYIVLEEDGSSFFRKGKMHGEYAVEGYIITLVWAGGRYSSFQIDENVLVGSYGDKWIKK